jgi:hypothetical protein
MDKVSENEVMEENAIIDKAELFIDEHGVLSVWVKLKYKTNAQDIGGYCLYIPESLKNHAVASPAGHFIYKLMQIAGVKYFSDIRGQPVRVKHTASHVLDIGHIICDCWLTPEKDFKRFDEQKEIANAD